MFFVKRFSNHNVIYIYTLSSMRYPKLSRSVVNDIWPSTRTFRVRLTSDIVIVPQSFHLIKIILKQRNKAKPQTIHVAHDTWIENILSNHVFKVINPPCGFSFPELRPARFYSLIRSWWSKSKAIHTYKYVCVTKNLQKTKSLNTNNQKCKKSQYE